MGKFTKSLTVVSLLIPVSGYSLGIGDIRVRSALNQNLNAEIGLMLTHGEDPNNIHVNLAPPEKFDEAGVSWSYFLSKMRFQPIVRSNGSVVIKVTSREALKEPYLNFLLEVSWPKGSLYREFTVLVDPPEDYQASHTFQEPSYANSSRQQNFAGDDKPVYRPARRRASRPKAVRHEQAAERADSQPIVKPRHVAVPSAGFGDQLVTRPNDSLSKVARRVRTTGVSAEQMMAAIYEKNPQAFYKQNMNALLANKRLKVPEQNEVQRISKQEALAELNRHNLAWSTNRGAIAASASNNDNEELADNQVKLEAPTDAAVTEKESVSPATEASTGSKTAQTEESGKSGANSDGKGRDTTGATSAVDEALQSKVAALEKQMAMMQELIALKDKQLAELQKSGVAPVTDTAKLPESTQVPNEASELVAEKPEQNSDLKPEVKPEPPAQTAVPPVQPVIEQQKPVVKPPVQTTAPATPVVPGEDSLPLAVWILGGLSALLLPLFGMLWWQRQKLTQETDTNSIFSPPSTLTTRSATKAPAKKQMPPESETLAGESSFLHDFKVSDFESFEAFNVEHGDIDPIAEADVYLAYGRYQQAEDLMRQAIKDTPERDECKLKLLEIFQASDNKEDFEDYVKELVAQGKAGDANFWRKVTEFGKAISPDFALLSAPVPSNVAVFDTESEDLSESVLLGVTTATQEPGTMPVVQEKTEHLGAATFEIAENDGEEAVFDASSTPSPALKEEDLQEKVTLDTSSEEVRAAFFEDDLRAEETDHRVLEFEAEKNDDDETLAFQSVDQLDFDLGPYPGSTDNKSKDERVVSFEKVEKPAQYTPKITELPTKNDVEAYEFDFRFDEDVKKPEPKAAPESPPIANWGEENLIEFNFDAPSEKEKASDKELEFSFDIDPEFVSSQKPAYKDHDFAVSDLTDMDEMETKLDLAKAYIDMGDIESAKDIIAQVIEKGSSEQRVAAQSLLDDLYLG